MGAKQSVIKSHVYLGLEMENYQDFRKNLVRYKNVLLVNQHFNTKLPKQERFNFHQHDTGINLRSHSKFRYENALNLKDFK